MNMQQGLFVIKKKPICQLIQHWNHPKWHIVCTLARHQSPKIIHNSRNPVLLNGSGTYVGFFIWQNRSVYSRISFLHLRVLEICSFNYLSLPQSHDTTYISLKFISFLQAHSWRAFWKLNSVWGTGQGGVKLTAAQNSTELVAESSWWTALSPWNSMESCWLLSRTALSPWNSMESSWLLSRTPLC